MAEQVHSTYLSMTVICILLLLAVGITASSIGLNSTLEAAADEEAPFDLTVQNQSADSAGLVDFPAVLAEGGLTWTVWESSWTYCLLQ